MYSSRESPAAVGGEGMDSIYFYHGSYTGISAVVVESAEVAVSGKAELIIAIVALDERTEGST